MINEPKRFILRSDTTEEWIKNNPLLRLGEIVADISLHKIKIGDGIHRYIDLPYQFDEIYYMINIIIRLLSNIDGTGTILDSVKDLYELNKRYTTTQTGNICFVVDEGRFYYFSHSGWVPATSQINNKLPVYEEQELYTKYPYVDKGTQIYVINDEHFYFYNGSKWIRIRNSNDDIIVSTVISLSELNDITKPLNGQIVYVLSKKLHYFYDGISWKLLKDQIGNNT